MSRTWLHANSGASMSTLFKNSSSRRAGATIPVGAPVPVDGDVHPGTAPSPAVVPGWATTVTVAGTLPPDIAATVAPRQSYVGVNVHPAPDDTRVHIHAPSVCSITGNPRRIVAIRVGGDVTIQFKTPADAYEWLWSCQQAIAEAL